MANRRKWIEEQVDTPDDSQVTLYGWQLRKFAHDAMSCADATRPQYPNNIVACVQCKKPVTVNAINAIHCEACEADPYPQLAEAIPMEGGVRRYRLSGDAETVYMQDGILYAKTFYKGEDIIRDADLSAPPTPAEPGGDKAVAPVMSEGMIANLEHYCTPELFGEVAYQAVLNLIASHRTLQHAPAVTPDRVRELLQRLIEANDRIDWCIGYEFTLENMKVYDEMQTIFNELHVALVQGRVKEE